MESDIKVLRGIKKYTFLLSPHAGLLKEVINNELVKETYLDGTEEYKLCPIEECINLNKGDSLKGVVLHKVEDPYEKGGEKMFILQSLFIPIFFSLIGFVFAILSTIYFSSIFEKLYSLSILLYFMGYIYIYMKNGFKEPMSSTTLFISIGMFFTFTIVGIFMDYFSHGLATNTMLNIYWFMVFLELVLKPSSIILSKNIRYWKYSIMNTDEKKVSDFYLITPRRIKK